MIYRNGNFTSFVELSNRAEKSTFGPDSCRTDEWLNTLAGAIGLTE
jgi:hypothetical protein